MDTFGSLPNDIEHENLLVNHRTTWLIATETALVAGYVYSFKAGSAAIPHGWFAFIGIFIGVVSPATFLVFPSNVERSLCAMANFLLIDYLIESTRNG